MFTAKQMIDKIKWSSIITDKSLYTVYYWDNVLKTLKPVKLKNMFFNEHDRFSFRITIDGESVDIPYHRIKQITYNEQIIWKRKIKDDIKTNKKIRRKTKQ